MHTPVARSWVVPRRLRGGGLGAQLVRGGIGSLGLKLSHALLSLAVTIVLARGLGAATYGVYAYVFALVSVIAMPAMFGLPTLIIRETAKAHVAERWGLMRGVWRWSALLTAVFSVVLALAAGLVLWRIAAHIPAPYVWTFAWGVLLVPLTALGNLRGAALRGLRRVLQGQLPEFVLRPGVFLLLLLGMLVWAPGRLTAAGAMALHVAAAAIAFVVGLGLLRRARPPELAARPPAEYETRAWLASVLPLAFVAEMRLINNHTDVVMLGFFTTADDVGTYRVAAQCAALVSFGLQAINTVVAPHFARLYTERRMDRLQQIVTFSARAALALTLPVVILTVVAGAPIIQAVFGSEYVAAAVPLAILAGGHLVNAACGSVAFLLNMTGHERATARGIAIAAAVNVPLNLVCIPLLGTAGAALATALSMALWNLLLWRAVRRTLAIDSTALGAGSLRMRS